MPIKRSELEKKWYYRAGKVFLLVLPLLAAIIWFLKSGASFPVMTQKNIAAIMQKNESNIIYGVIGLVAYFLALKLVWRTILYIVFGGLEEDTVKRGGETTQPGQAAWPATPSGQGALSDEDKKQIGFYLFLLIMIGLIYWIVTYTPAQNWIPGRSNNGGNSGSTCIPTGCGSQWFCSGSYYDANGTRRSLNACLPRRAGETYSSWSGTCRQCP